MPILGLYTKKEIDNLLKAAGPKYPDWMLATAEAQQYDIPDSTNTYNQLDLYHKLSWVNVAVTIPAGIGSGAELKVYKVGGEEDKEVKGHDFVARLHHPNPDRCRSDLWFDTLAYYGLTGNAYWWLNCPNESAPPAEIWVVPNYRIEPIPDGQMYIKGYKYDPGTGNPITLGVNEVIHFKGFAPINQWVGVSSAEPVEVVAETDKKAQKWNKKYFEGNAKLPGALGFATPINDTDWEKMQGDVQKQADKRNMLMLRGVGPGGVQWVQMTTSMKDMEFIAGRKSNRDEIWNVYAPGLVAMLSESATEANSRTGKAVLIEQRVWPHLVKLAETITNKLLPRYGENLVARFDDIRVTDRVLELKEQQEFGKVHTINEIRKKFYQGEDLKDERGEMLPAQITPLTPVGSAEPAPRKPAPAPQTPEEQEEPEKEIAQDVEEVKADMRPAIMELEKYQRRVLRALKEGKSPAVEFDFYNTPAETAEAVKAQVALCRDEAAVRDVVEGAVRACKAVTVTAAPKFAAQTTTELVQAMAIEMETIKAVVKGA